MCSNPQQPVSHGDRVTSRSQTRMAIEQSGEAADGRRNDGRAACKCLQWRDASSFGERRHCQHVGGSEVICQSSHGMYSRTTQCPRLAIWEPKLFRQLQEIVVTASEIEHHGI